MHGLRGRPRVRTGLCGTLRSPGMRLLVLGGTQFVGRAIVESALGAGHVVTLLNRGLTEPTGEQLFGER